MIKLFNLQNKLIQIQHRMSKDEFVNANVPKEQFEGYIKAELYKQLADYMLKQLPIQSIPNGNEVEFFTSGYMLTEKDMLNILLEVCQLDDKGRNMLEVSCMKQLNM